jgi:hypothetical protein
VRGAHKLPRRLVLALALALPHPAAAAPPVTAPEAAAIRAVIEAQLRALSRDDAAAAYAHASKMIQGLFPTPADFLGMVRTLYPPVHRPRRVQFGDVVEMSGRIVQRVELIGPDGAPALALYTMVRDGAAWRIDGCMLTESENPAS